MGQHIKVNIEWLDHGQGLQEPGYETKSAAGMDIRVAVDEPITIHPGDRALVPTGFRMALPEGYEAQIRPRSGLAYKHGITMLNTPGTIDADYRGEVKILAINLGDKPYTVHRGDRLAQMVIAPITQAQVAVVDHLDDTARGDGGFGSTGKS
ncbi:MAG: dUTP diphosphatase [Bacteroidota bacterium]